jgi:hypothetical protein
VQVHCRAPLDVVVARYTDRAGRDRHPGHVDHILVRGLEARYESGVHGPLDLERDVIEVDMAAPVDGRALADRVRELAGVTV